jgi:hypothetical protein
MGVFAFAFEPLPPAWDTGAWSAISFIVWLNVEYRCAVISVEAFHSQRPASLTEQSHERETDRVWSMGRSCSEDPDLLNVNTSSRVNPQSVTPSWCIVKPEQYVYV